MILAVGRPDLHTRYWRRVIRPLVLQRDPWCPGFPDGYHRGELVPTAAVDHIDPSYVLSGEPARDLAHLRGLCMSCNSRKAVAQEGAHRWHR